MATLASQPRGKFGGNYTRQQTKKDLHVGPESFRQHKQATWEMLQAKKIQKIQAHERDEAALVQKQPFAMPAAMGVPTVPWRQHDTTSRFRLCSAHPMTTAILFTLLLVAPTVSAATEISPQRPRHDPSARGYGYVIGNPPIAYECRGLENFYLEHLQEMTAEVVMAKQYEPEIGTTNYPAFLTTRCLPFHEYTRGSFAKDQVWTGQMVDNAETITDAYIAFINDFGRKSEDFHTRYAAYVEKVKRENDEIANQNAKIMKETEEQNRGVIRQVLTVIKEINEYMNEHMNGRSYQFSPRYQQAFDFFSKNPERCISNADEECKRELASIHNIEVISHSASDEEFIRELTGIDLKEHPTCL